MKSLTPLMRLLESVVSGPRDWYRIEHCKTGIGKSYFGVRVCVWRDDWPEYSEGEAVYLSMAITEALKNYEDSHEKPKD